MENALKSQDTPSPEQDAIQLALNELQSRLQRWKNALESGELSIEHAAQRIRELHEQRQELLKKKQALDLDRSGARKIFPIPNSQINSYIAEMQLQVGSETNWGKKGIPARGIERSAATRQRHNRYLQIPSDHV